MDPEISDSQLLRSFLQGRDERALRLLMERHLPMAYAVALRASNHPELAAEAAQDAFIKLARTPGILMKDSVPLIAWLHRTARHRAVDLVRSEAARKQREKAAVFQPSPAANVAEMSPEALGMLDEVIEHLPAPDRDLVLQRYFLGRSLATIGGQRGLSEDAVRMRLKRSLEKMRRLFEVRGVRTTTALLGSSLPLYGGTVPPAGVAAVVIAAMGGSAAPKISLSFLLYAMTTTQKYIAGASALACAGLITIAVKSHSIATTEDSPAPPGIAGDAPAATGSSTLGKNPARKTSREATANAELAAKYGEARTKLALHLAKTVTQITSDTSDIDRSPKFFEEQQGSRRYMVNQLAENLDLRNDQKDALLNLVPEWGKYASEQTAKRVALLSTNPSAVAESALAIDAWNQGKMSDDEFHEILSRNGRVLEMKEPEFFELLSSRKQDSGADAEATAAAPATTEFLDDYPALRKALESSLDAEQEKKYAEIPKTAEPRKITPGDQADLEEISDNIEAQAKSTAAWAEQVRKGKR